MSLRLEMLQVARLSPRLLSDSTALVHDFILSKLNPDGGFQDRAGQSDLYYTVFGLSCLLALQGEPPKARVAAYLRGFGDGADLDLIHQCALARCWACLGQVPDGVRTRTLQQLAACRAENGGYHVSPGMPHGSAYGMFMAMGAFQDIDRPIPEADRWPRALHQNVSGDGGFADGVNLPLGTTPATAAAESILRTLGRPFPERAGRWLLKQFHPQGGFLALPGAPMPDLLSTATALHALAGRNLPLTEVREPCLDYVDSLWVNKGAFHGNWADESLDVEYTFYGLLALGHLSL